jgi:hypothetical protein
VIFCPSSNSQLLKVLENSSDFTGLPFISINVTVILVGLSSFNLAITSFRVLEYLFTWAVAIFQSLTTTFQFILIINI